MEWENVNDMEEMEAQMFKDFVQNATLTEISNAICFLNVAGFIEGYAIKYAKEHGGLPVIDFLEKEMNRP